MDGTLVDTEPLWRREKLRLLERIGLELSDDEIEATVGVYFAVWVSEWITRAGSTLDPSRTAAEILGELVAGVGPSTLHEETAGEVRRLADAALPQAIVSASDRPLVDAGLAVLPPVFGASIAADDVAKRKPDPEAYLLAATRLDVDPRRCRVVEDSVTGALAALAAGCDVAVIDGPQVAAAAATGQLAGAAIVSRAELSAILLSPMR